jgi:ADP-ribose pyrophosphatase YjhB (NUDIX family)
MALVRDAFCSFCGTKSEATGYPRTCASCATTIWANPIPVVVVLAPIEHAGKTGLLVVRRAIPPQIGKLGLVGGFLEEHESWQVGGAREVREETGATVDPTTLQPYWYASSSPKPNRVLMFCVAPPQPATAMPPWTPDKAGETSERGAVFGPEGIADVFAFSTHIEAAQRWFSERGITGGHGFTAL